MTAWEADDAWETEDAWSICPDCKHMFTRWLGCPCQKEKDANRRDIHDANN